MKEIERLIKAIRIELLNLDILIEELETAIIELCK